VRIPSGVTDQYIYFDAVDSSDLVTAETGLATFTVYRSRNGAAAAAMTTPTINETDSSNMPGIYELLLDEDMSIAAGNDSEEMIFYITHAGMAPVKRVIELYRPKITAGETLSTSGGVAEANLEEIMDHQLIQSSAGRLANNFEQVFDNGDAAASLTLDDVSTVTNSSVADAVWDEVLTGATHNVANSAGRRLRQLQEAGGYSGGAVYIDTVNGTAGTTSFENGVDTNPVNSIADANTIAGNVGISTFIIAPGSTITFAASQQNQAFIGRGGWTLALGGQDIAGTLISNANVSGIASGTGTTQKFIDCLMGATSHIAGTHLLTCGIAGTQTMVEAGDHFWDRCHSGVAGTGTPSFSFGAAIGNSNLNIRNYSGGIQLEAMGDTGTDTATIEGRGQIVEGTCTGGTVAVRGQFTTSGISNLTLSDNARLDITQVNDQVLDVLNTDTFVESAAVPAATATLVAKIGWLTTLARNKLTQTATTQTIRNDGDSGDIATSAVSDDGTTFTRAEWT
jgi:hypothetical protein